MSRIAARVATAFVIALSVSVSSLSAAQCVGLTSSNRLVSFDCVSPGIASTVAIIGLQPGETMVGIDVRPATLALYGVTDQSRIYRVSHVSGLATFVADLNDAGGNVALSGSSFGLDVNPVIDRIRLVSDSDENIRIDPDTGAVAVDANLAFAPGDNNYGSDPRVVAVAYSNNYQGATSTTFYGIDAASNSLVASSADNGTISTVGGVGLDVDDNAGFDIDRSGAFALAALKGTLFSNLFRINLTTGAATLVGQIGSGFTITGLAILDNGPAMCKPGTSSANGSEPCSACPAGTYSSTAGANACTSCGGNTYSNAGSSQCTACPTGYQPNASHTACEPIPCQPGSSGANGYEPCSACPAGTYSSTAGANACTSCGGNTYSNAGSSQCTACPTGYQPNASHTACEALADCAPGTFSPTGTEPCSACPAGMYSPQSGAQTCEPCPAGSANDVTGQSACGTCTGNSFSATIGSSQCTPCPPGTQANANHTGCVATNACTPGSFSPTGNEPCATCSAGTYSTTSGSTECAACPPGTFSGPGQTSCAPCSNNTYSSTYGSAQCSSCPNGTQANATHTGCEPIGTCNATVSGGGRTTAAGGGAATFSFLARQRADGTTDGHFLWNNQQAKCKIEGPVSQMTACSGDGTATFTGTCGPGCTFVVRVRDAGAGGAHDRINVSIAGSCPGTLGEQALLSGNIQHH